MERLQKVISQSGVTSRRKAEDLIVNGKVKVNGVVETKLGTKVDSNAKIEVNGVLLNNNLKKVYYLLYKPRGVISSVSDDKNRKTVVSLIDTEERIYPIGRLDYDTSGLILLTNDGDLANILMHPKNNVEKTYIVKIEGNLAPKEFMELKKGIVIDDRLVIPTHLKVKKTTLENQIIEITIVEGRNHIIKKIFAYFGYDVLKLKRESYAFLSLGNLKPGEYRTLSLKEVKKLYSLKTK